MKRRRRPDPPERERPDAVVSIGRDPAGRLTFGVDWFSAAAHALLLDVAQDLGVPLRDLMQSMAQRLYEMDGEGEYAMQADAIRQAVAQEAGG